MKKLCGTKINYNLVLKVLNLLLGYDTTHGLWHGRVYQKSCHGVLGARTIQTFENL
jgi:hypothetical protein